MKKFRPAAVPLVTTDPYFSIWSFADGLTEDVTRHWTGRRNAMTMFLSVDGTRYRVMGRVRSDNYRYHAEDNNIVQTSCRVEATQTEYIFENEVFNLKLKFRTPLLTEDLVLMSSPVTYIGFEVDFKDGQKHSASLYFDISSECCVDDLSDEVSFGTTGYSIYCGKGERDILKGFGDDKMIEWGNLHLIMKDAKYKVYSGTDRYEMLRFGNKRDGIGGKRKVNDDFPVISAEKDYGISDGISDYLCVAYDDIYSIEYFGEKLKPYWREEGNSFEAIVKKAVEDYTVINRKCDIFDAKLREEAGRFGEKYADIICLSYRQVIAAHKLCKKDGKLLFFSKECNSGGNIATVDVTYPSIPMFLMLKPELVQAMLNPIYEYVDSGRWKHGFAPHDVGFYPIANGQTYAWEHTEEQDEDGIVHMPVEECGNMLLCTAAVCKANGNAEYAKDKLNLLKSWTEYLIEVGYDPDKQLCTDDFAGPLAHNCNLSLKLILAIAAFGYILELVGEDGSEYMKIARVYAKKWEEKAFANDHYKLAFDREDTWSLKYNLIWDKFFGFGLFSEKVAETEIEYYKTKINKYGVPLDSRKGYTKSDWQMWTTCLSDDKEYFDMIVDAMWRNISDMKQRVPFSDYYETTEASQVAFQNRTVQGGLFMPMLF